MTRRRHVSLRATALVLTLAATACAGGDDEAADSTIIPLPGATEVPSTLGSPGSPPTASDASTTAAPTTAATTAPTTTAGPTTTAAPTTTAGPTTTVDPTAVPDVDAKAFVVYDMRAGRQLAAEAGDERLPVGSLMKLLTAQVAFAAGDPTKIVTAPDGLIIDPDESQIGIAEGQELPRDLLVRALLKASANDAARLLALDIAGSEAAYAELMNGAAAQLGLANTHAVNVTGLDAEGQYSSAADMAKLGVFLMGNVTFQQTVKDPVAELNGQAFPNQNDLLTTYPGADGIKTGRTTDAGWCVLGSATRDNRRIVVAVLGASSDEARVAAASALLDWGFAQP